MAVETCASAGTLLGFEVGSFCVAVAAGWVSEGDVFGAMVIPGPDAGVAVMVVDKSDGVMTGIVGAEGVAALATGVSALGCVRAMSAFGALFSRLSGVLGESAPPPPPLEGICHGEFWPNSVESCYYMSTYRIIKSFHIQETGLPFRMQRIQYLGIKNDDWVVRQVRVARDDSIENLRRTVWQA